MNKAWKLLACATALTAVGAAPAPALAKQRHRNPHVSAITGVVVHENNPAHSFVVAERSGRLDAIHGHQLAVGEKVRVKVARLVNGTFAAKREQILTRPAAHNVRIAGVVSADDPATHEVVVSSNGTSIPVDTSGAGGDETPPVGEDVAAEVEVEPDGTVKGDGVTDSGQSATFRVEGKILSIDDQARTLTISADDDDQTGQDVTVTLPSSFDMSAYSVGDCIELTVTKAADGTLTAVQSFGDDSRHDANNGGHGRDRGGPSGDQSNRHDGDQQGSGSGPGSSGDQSGAGSSPQSSGEQSGGGAQSGSDDQSGSDSSGR